jgi:hypothetical protein
MQRDPKRTTSIEAWTKATDRSSKEPEMADLQEILLRVLRELGPDASDDEIGKKMGEYVEALPESDRAQVMGQMIRLTDSAELAHLREMAGNETGQTVEKPDGDSDGDAAQ